MGILPGNKCGAAALTQPVVPHNRTPTSLIQQSSIGSLYELTVALVCNFVDSAVLGDLGLFVVPSQLHHPLGISGARGGGGGGGWGRGAAQPVVPHHTRKSLINLLGHCSWYQESVVMICNVTDGEVLCLTSRVRRIWVCLWWWCCPLVPAGGSIDQFTGRDGFNLEGCD